MNTLKLYLLLFTVMTSVILSCSKEQKSSKIASNTILKNGQGLSPSNSKATRLAKQIQVTNPETGAVSIYFDCREPGRSCDVGEDDVPSPDGGGETRVVNESLNSERKAIGNYLSTKNSEYVLNYLNENKGSLSRIFPKFFDADLGRELKSGKYEFLIDYNSIAVVQNTKLKEPLFVYSYLDMFGFDEIEIESGGRVAKINTQTGVVECLDSGNNCKISARRQWVNVAKPNYLKIIEKEFGKALAAQVYDGTYLIFDSRKRIEIRPAVKEGEVYYILK